MTFRKFDVTRDCRWALQKEWLNQQEQLIAYAGVDLGKTYVEVPGHYRDGRPYGNLIIKSIKALGWGIVYGLFFWLIADNYSGRSVDREAPPVVVWGSSSVSQALPTGLYQARGVWAISDARIAFLQIEDTTTSTEHSTDGGMKPSPVRLTPIFEAKDFRYRGRIERSRHTRFTKQLKWSAEFHRVVLNDGSGVDLLVRNPPKPNFGDR